MCYWQMFPTTLLSGFQENILKFGVWGNTLWVNEMMTKSYARTSSKQFIRGKSTRFALNFGDFALQMDIHWILTYIVEKINYLETIQQNEKYKYFENFFTNLNLVVHLKNLELKCTGTIRENSFSVNVSFLQSFHEWGRCPWWTLQ